MTDRVRSRPVQIRILAAAAGAAAVLLAVTAGASGAAGSVQRTNHASGPGFTKTESLARDNLVDGKNSVVDRRTFHLSVDETQNLRDRQEINVNWTGAHPTGGLVPDQNSEVAAQQEYPVVLMMCRGTASQVSPKTCFTETPAERFQSDTTDNFPPYRIDRYASVKDRAQQVGVPSHIPSGCPSTSTGGVQHWVPFVSVTGKVYYGGFNGCAGLPPEDTNFESSLQPANTTYAASDLHGNGSTKFVITTNETNASLGCSDKVACSLVVIPIMGTSCDAAGNDVPPIDRPQDTTTRDAAFAACSAKGAFAPGQIAPPSSPNQEDLAVSGELWWTASNWRDRIAVPLSFAPPSNVCNIDDTSATPTDIYGSPLLTQATLQWAPHFCLNRNLFRFQHVQTSEPEAKNLLNTGSIGAAFQGNPPPGGFSKPVAQAPTAVTGFAIVYDIDNAQGKPYTTLKLDARLLAKLLTESYTSDPAVADYDTKLQNPETHKPNPYDLAQDPEFRALNPGLPADAFDEEPASTLMSIASDSDAVRAMTSYINADPAARAWLNGKPDPWGMVVNPAYRHISLPVDSFPLRDTFVPTTIENVASNSCLADPHVPWLPLVASPVSDMATVTLDIQFDQANSQIDCANPGAQNQKLVGVGREAPGQRFILGITALGDARRYQLNSAALETHSTANDNAQFTTSAGRSFASPSDSGLRAAVRLLKPDPATGTWPVPYAAMHRNAADKTAYPGTILISTDVPVAGLPKVSALDYSEFLDFVAGEGQRPGLGNGDLPPGYLPMTAANGLASEVAYTKAVATAVLKQDGTVPLLTPGTHSAHSQNKHSSGAGETSTSTGGGGTPGSGPSGSSPIPGSSSSPGGPQKRGSTASTPAPVSLGDTASVTSTAAGTVLPVILLLAIIGATGAALVGLRRPKRTP